MPPNVIDLMDESSSPTRTTPRKAQSTTPERPELNISALLEQAICNTSLNRLQQTLREICGVNSAASCTACELLLVDNQRVENLTAGESSQGEEEGNEDDSTSKNKSLHRWISRSTHLTSNPYPEADGTPPKNVPTSTTFTSSTLKRFRVRFATCKNCSEEYDVSCNSKGDCIWHEGTMITTYSYILS